ncbi:hypothetical protein [Ferrimicrobium acidiphilum]
MVCDDQPPSGIQLDPGVVLTEFYAVPADDKMRSIEPARATTAMA